MSQITDQDIEKFYKLLYFGRDNDNLKLAINSAYTDLNRTLRGFATHPNKINITNSCKDILYKDINNILSQKNLTQKDFDLWHKACCDKLKVIFHDFKINYGQCQKWINMAFKYYYLLNNELGQGIWKYLHIPLDSIMFEKLEELGIQKFETPWSKIDNYNEYFIIQLWVRENIKEVPMTFEFKAFL